MAKRRPLLLRAGAEITDLANRLLKWETGWEPYQESIVEPNGRTMTIMLRYPNDLPAMKITVEVVNG